MAIFIGTEKEFLIFVEPRIKNIVNSIAKRERDACNKICQHCKTVNVELQSAHIYGKERRALINKVLQKYKKEEVFQIDLQQFENEIKEAHYPIRDTFLFLCASCHRVYDSLTIDKVVDFLKSSDMAKDEINALLKCKKNVTLPKIDLIQNETQKSNNIIKIDSIFNKNNPKKEYILNGQKVDKSNFEKRLQNNFCQVKITLYYEDKNPEIKIWNARKITNNSNLDGNLNSGYLRGWREKGIIKIKLEL